MVEIEKVLEFLGSNPLSGSSAGVRISDVGTISSQQKVERKTVLGNEVREIEQFLKGKGG